MEVFLIQDGGVFFSYEDFKMGCIGVNKPSNRLERADTNRDTDAHYESQRRIDIMKSIKLELKNNPPLKEIQYLLFFSPCKTFRTPIYRYVLLLFKSDSPNTPQPPPAQANDQDCSAEACPIRGRIPFQQRLLVLHLFAFLFRDRVRNYRSDSESDRHANLRNGIENTPRQTMHFGREGRRDYKIRHCEERVCGDWN